VGSRFTSLLLKETIQFSRDRLVLFLILFLYVVDTVMCTLALSYDVKNVSLAIVDLDTTLESRDLTARFFSTNAFRSAGHPSGETEARSWLTSGQAIAVVTIPKNFARDLRRGTQTKVQILLDGSNSNTALIARGYVLRIIEMFEQAWTPIDSAKHAMAVPVVRVWYNPSLSFCRCSGSLPCWLASFNPQRRLCARRKWARLSN